MDRQNGAAALMEFNWQRQPEAENLVLELITSFLERNPTARLLADRMQNETGTRFRDWIDRIDVSDSDNIRERLGAAGYTRVRRDSSSDHYAQRAGVFPSVGVWKKGGVEIRLKVESVSDFNAVFANPNDIEGEPLSVYRQLYLGGGVDAGLCVVERHGCQGFDEIKLSADNRLRRIDHWDKFRSRVREWDDEGEGFDVTEMMLDSAIKDLGVDLTCDLFFAAEREYWQRRNRAAQFQKARQDRLGLGWANHDHHTYRCSRKYFSRLIGLWEKLGFQLRERFYAGAEAGWGAQVCEQPNAGIITFNDVDLSPEELLNDFSHEPLPERKELGTVGLWCGLHGESFLQAGMHHLECQFDFDSLKKQMEEQGGIKVMKPFTDFPYLRQAFTEGERWPVKEDRLAMLLEKGQITQEQAAQFRTNGAIGSHLENLERNEGFKGFNQKGVSEIIAKTDPRKNV